MYSTDKANFKANVSKAYSSGSKYINETGSYRAMIEYAYWEENHFGGKDLVIHLLDESEKTAKLNITYENDKGERQYGANVLDALIVISDAKKGLTAASATAMIYSWVDKSVVEQSVNGCPELTGKWFEFLLKERKHAYIGKTGDKAGQVVKQETVTISSIFQDKTLLSALEIMDKVTIAEEYNKQKAYLDANPVYETDNYKKFIVNGAAPQQSAGSYGSVPEPIAKDLEDDLPW